MGVCVRKGAHVSEIPLLPILLYLLGMCGPWLPLAGDCQFWTQDGGVRAPPSTSAQDTFRRGVWLGRHIFYKTTRVSEDKLSENRNLT